jgi:hypothetical protein
MSKPEEFKFDSRIRDRFLRSRVLSSSEVQKHLDELPDLEGEYEVLNDTPQPAVTPPRSEVHEEPLVFDGIRRLQALSESNTAASQRYVAPVPTNSGLSAYREPESRPLGTPLRSALMESEISGVGAGAVSAALGAMAAEARGASVFGIPASIPQPPAEEAVPPLTLRSEPSVGASATTSSVSEPSLEEDEDDEDEDEDEDDLDDDEDGDDEDADDEDADEADEVDADADADEVATVSASDADEEESDKESDVDADVEPDPASDEDLA